MASDDVLDAYMVITGSLATGGTIEGETLDSVYGPQKGFQILDFSWGVDHSGGGSGGDDDDEDGQDGKKKKKNEQPESFLMSHNAPSRGKGDRSMKGSTLTAKRKKKEVADEDGKDEDGDDKKKKKKKKGGAGNTMVTKADLRVNKVNITKYFDSASTSLFDAICDDLTEREGQLTGTVYFRKAGALGSGPPFVYFTVTFYELMVISVDWSFDDEFPTEEVEFEFNRVRIMYYPQLADGTAGSPLTASWDRNADMETNTAVSGGFYGNT